MNPYDMDYEDFKQKILTEYYVAMSITNPLSLVSVSNLTCDILATKWILFSRKLRELTNIRLGEFKR